MAFGSFVLTDFGHMQLVKSHAGKEIHFSRLALGDGDIGTSSVYDVTALKSEKLSLLIDAVSITDADATVTTLLQSSAVGTGFNLKEMGLMATDPDTKQEGVYAYNRDTSAGEYIPDKNSSSKLSEYLRIHCNVEGATNVTFNSSGNPLWITREELVTNVNNQIAAKTGVTGGIMGYDDAHKHITDTDIHVTATQKASWTGKAEKSDIPTSLPANGGHAASADTASMAYDTTSINSALTVTTSEPPGTLSPGKLWGVY